VRIGIANDVPVMAESLRRIVSMRPGTRVVWIAKDGAEAVSMCARDTPDLVLMDMIMPNLDGVEATRQIMARSPCAILVTTSSVGSNSQRVFEAMGYGALDAVDTPTLASDGARLLLSTIDRLSRVMTSRSGTYTAPSITALQPALACNALVAIGSSAGGPAALAKVLTGLPRNFGASIVVVQHVDERFAASLADWLNRLSPLPVRVAEEGEAPLPGTVLLAGTRDHLTFKTATRLGYTPEPTDHVYRPSVDVFLQSMVRMWRGDAVGVLLTGMGRDGAVGLKAVRGKGWHTIAQDQATSAVYGMPKAAAEIGAAVDILPLDRIAARIRRALDSQDTAAVNA
jgi:two-component system, chemotaxis family, response regulator WspF